MNRPYVIIHTHTSLEGGIHSMDLPGFRSASRQYQDLALTPGRQVLEIDGYLNGRVTAEDNATHYRKPDVDEKAAPVPEGDFIADPSAPMYYVSIDPSGRLAWQQNRFDYGGVSSHIIEVLTARASNAYKDFLRRLNISYVIAGDDALDNALVLHKLATAFGMDRVMIGGGGVLNWSFLQSGLVDEVSIVMAPIADGSPDSPRLFMTKEPLSKVQPRSFSLIEAKPLEDSTVWLRYRVNRNESEERS